MVPITVTLVAVVLLRERPGRARWVGIALAVGRAVGVNVLSVQGIGQTAGPHSSLGALLLVAAVMCEAVFVTFGRLLSTPMAPAALALVLAVLGACMLAIPAGLEVAWGSALTGVSWQAWALMIYSGVAINGIAAVLVYESLDTVDATVLAGFLALTPVAGALLAVPLLGEQLHLYRLMGICVAVVGVYVASRDATALPVLAGPWLGLLTSARRTRRGGRGRDHDGGGRQAQCSQDHEQCGIAGAFGDGRTQGGCHGRG